VTAQEKSSPLSPKDALKGFRVPEGFTVELVASEPELMSPVALAFDENGRLYVVEMADYPLGPPSGRIKLLESTKGDGHYDKCTLFAKDIPYPNGVMCWKGGILVTVAPDILFFRDSQGDGRADVKEVIYTGFVEGNQQHRVNHLELGIDNWIYGANGDSGGNIRTGKNPASKRVAIRGADFRFKPDFSVFEPVSGHSQYANTFDDWGNRFINDNSNHIRHPVLPLRYLGRNPNLSVAAVEDNIPDHGPAGQVFPSSALEPRFNDPQTAGHFTSACAVTIYHGDAFPAEYRGSAFCCEPVHNLVHRDLLVPKGASFVAQRADPKSEFFTSTDNWCRPVNLTVGPDGCLYVVDMYRAVIEHPQWIPLDIQKRIDLRAGSDRGRIWRIAPSGLGRQPIPRLGVLGSVELVSRLASPNGWTRRTAQRLLIERRGRSVVEPLESLFADPATPPLGRLHALWTLEGLGSLGEDLMARALVDPDPGIREHALRLSESRLGESPGLRKSVLARVDDPSPRVRFQLAFTLGEIKDDPALEALSRIAVRDAEDRWTRVAVLSSIPGRSPQLLREIEKSKPEFLEAPSPAALELVRQLADLAGASRSEEQVGEWLRLLAQDAGPEPARWRLVALSALGPSLRRWGVGLDPLLKKAGVEGPVAQWAARLSQAATDPGRDVAERVNAIELLALMPTPEVARKLEGLLTPKEPQDVQVATVRALASWPGDPSVGRLLAGWPGYTTQVRRAVLGALFARPAQIPVILEKLEKGEIRAVELEAAHRERLLNHPTASIRERARKLLEAKSTSELDELIAQMSQKIFALRGDPLRGEKVYMTNCSTCHRLNGQGYPVGPALESVRGRDRMALLVDILDPNRAIDPAYQQYVAKTKSGEMISGIIASETPTSLTLKRANAETTTILRRDLDVITAWPASLMPEGIEKNVSAQDFADLLVFLGASANGLSPGARKIFQGNSPEVVKAKPDGSLSLPAAQGEIFGTTLVFETRYKNLGYWSSENDQAIWSLEATRPGKYSVLLDYACDSGVAGNDFVLEIGDARLTGKIAGTGSWDEYREARLGAVELKAGAQRLLFRSSGKIAGALLDLRTIRLVPE
jgi:putative membrane-bound dehydrogenase-like protein